MRLQNWLVAAVVFMLCLSIYVIFGMVMQRHQITYRPVPPVPPTQIPHLPELPHNTPELPEAPEEEEGPNTDWPRADFHRNAHDVLAGHQMFVRNDVIFPANSTSKWFVTNNKDLVYIFFFDAATNDRVLRTNTPLTVKWASSKPIENLPGSRKSVGDECVLETYTSNGTKVWILMTKGHGMNVEKKDTGEWVYTGTGKPPTLGDIMPVFRVLMPEPEVIKW